MMSPDIPFTNESPCTFMGALEDKDLLDSWYKALDDCSFSLIKILIEHRQKLTDECSQNIEKIQKDLLSHVNNPEYKKILKEITDRTDKYQDDIVQSKSKKLQRDQIDYNNNQVYTFNRVEKEKLTLSNNPNEENKGQRNSYTSHKTEGENWTTVQNKNYTREQNRTYRNTHNNYNANYRPHYNENYRFNSPNPRNNYGPRTHYSNTNRHSQQYPQGTYQSQFRDNHSNTYQQHFSPQHGFRPHSNHPTSHNQVTTNYHTQQPNRTLLERPHGHILKPNSPLEHTNRFNILASLPDEENTPGTSYEHSSSFLENGQNHNRHPFPNSNLSVEKQRKDRTLQTKRV
ncbi:GATA zinc finger domain-containing protein 14-like [Bombina bombina]|uniref:GATA zinc finger domain-containing protein 14-like n=1 Tax=Bombina bombina TaxID=8345 RepID=UPI00235B0A22|nr:GATA zinc finger domain-containing protein 14-like [Bombina bombina]